MRIGLFTDTYTPDINGVVSSIVTLQRELEKNGHDVYVITNHKAMTMKKEGNVLRLPGLELKWLYGYKLSTPYHFSARDEIKNMHLDVIHVHTEFGVGMFGRIVAKYLNIPVVTTYHTMYEDYTHYVNRFEIDEVDKVTKKVVSTFSRSISDSAQAVISPSEKTKETLLKYGVKTPIYVIPTGLNFDKFHPDNINPQQVQAIREQYGIHEDERLIVFVGRIAQEKSIEIPIEGFRYVKDPKIKLMIVGGGPQLEELQEMVKRYHLEKQVIFTDKKLPEEVPAYYACADCFVSASLTETQGMTYIEALACGLPVFARYDDVLKDLVIEEDSGFLFETPQEFADKLTDFMHRSDEERKAFSKRALEKIVKYDSKVFYSKVLSVYYQAINDFEDAYEVIKIKTLDDYVRIYVQNDKEDQPQKLLIDLDDYFTYKIRLHTMLDRYTVAHFQKKEIVLEAYRGAIRKLRMRDYTRKEMGTWLHRQPGLSVEDVESILSELEEKGYINDALYMQQKIEKMQFSLSGKGNIRRTLINKGLPAEDVDQALSMLDDEEERLRALKMAEKLMATIKDKSRKMKKQTIVQKLISLGFDSDIARSTSERLNFEEEDDSEALNKTIAKAIRSNSRKLSGQPLKNKVLVYCMQKGFLHEDIMNRLNEMEWRDEQ
ncbi:glycosyltransferase [Erysipelotrichaceae bacterium AF15-26LB]|mgnify:FL=1|nr:regulatory protein RecX [Erysipelotrichaceae bacterium 3_1_53]MCR0349120.1 RecX family transcriptional regulator [[Clostridium] innocuum]RJV83924.1 glycosyltransferase [Erysipelotrichaceae bacterium AF15-26LB]RJV88101.1 glycosyltransferase [Erysipelotrichaceae bacterium AF19-24AC]